MDCHRDNRCPRDGSAHYRPCSAHSGGRSNPHRAEGIHCLRHRFARCDLRSRHRGPFCFPDSPDKEARHQTETVRPSGILRRSWCRRASAARRAWYTLMLCSDSSANHNYYVYADGYMDIAKDGAITRYRYNGTKVNDELTLIDTSSLYAISFYERGF